MDASFEICRQVLLQELEPEPALDEEIISESASETRTVSDDDFDEEIDMLSDIDALIKERYPELKPLSSKARGQLNDLVCEMIDRYRL